MQELQPDILEYEIIIRMLFFVGIVIVMSLLEYVIPRRKLLLPKLKRWFNNISLVFLNTLLLRVLFPTAAIGISVFANNQNIGLFNILELNYLFSIIAGIILLDLIIYTQHRLLHRINFFWKFHKVHHSDMDYDLTTGFRFHPCEIILSMCIKVFFIFILGIPVIAVLIFEVILSTLSVFNHSNIHLPKKLDQVLRYFIVTPDMHRIHHSIHHKELNSNYGFNLSVWDKIFNSYQDMPKESYDKMTIGLKELQDENKTVSILKMLKLPFQK